MTLIELLKTIPDPRGKRGKRHPLWLALFISLLGSLCGYWGYRPLAKFCKKHRKTLLKLLNLDPNQVILPSYSTFRRIFQRVNAQDWVRFESMPHPICPNGGTRLALLELFGSNGKGCVRENPFFMSISISAIGI